MPIVINATQEKVTLLLQGNYFSWNPGQEKVIRNEDLARFIAKERGDSGLAVLPDLQSDDEMLSPEEFETRKASHKEARTRALDEALDRYIKRLREVIYNNQVSLRRDLEQANIKADPGSFASAGEIEAMRLVSKYQRRSEDEDAKRLAETKRLMGEINKGDTKGT
jgi:hypothetical protein